MKQFKIKKQTKQNKKTLKILTTRTGHKSCVFVLKRSLRSKSEKTLPWNEEKLLQFFFLLP
ncbi:hypothetical protein DOY81_006137 [Sarcophaga bullata]|nr:hypothetical protein DOY81_006137 [Sarcophaga bullata]